MANLVKKSLAGAVFLGLLGTASPSLAACFVDGPLLSLQLDDAALLVAVVETSDGSEVLLGCQTVSVPLQAAGSAAASVGLSVSLEGDIEACPTTIDPESVNDIGTCVSIITFNPVLRTTAE